MYIVISVECTFVCTRIHFVYDMLRHGYKIIIPLFKQSYMLNMYERINICTILLKLCQVEFTSIYCTCKIYVYIFTKDLG